MQTAASVAFGQVHDVAADSAALWQLPCPRNRRPNGAGLIR